MYVFVTAAWEESTILAEGLQSLDYSTEVEAEICKNPSAGRRNKRKNAQRAGRTKKAIIESQENGCAQCLTNLN
ncbi:putative 50S ribosomal protein L23 [Roseibium sp. TrichSKD4]|nr:putative 50S ribosomal protein L23 [Roseibium sp. TrichSKD4]